MGGEGPRAARTLGALRASGYRTRPVRLELRANLLARLASGAPIFPGLIGYEETVVPELENAILSGHHIVLLGERGQAKSRIVRALATLLDEAVPAVDGCPIHDDPFAPICAACRRRAAELGDALPVRWIGPEARYGEKLATPDVSMADLIGEVDPVRVAEGRSLADEETIHFGLLPRANRGIFAINELPDLAEKVQVGLFNVMEERDVQIRGYAVRLPLDVVVVATANPEDYTSRGRIVTPLKDRFDAQIRTHYPRTIDDEIAIVLQEVGVEERDGRAVRVAPYLLETLARLSFEARASEAVSRTSGVSVRASLNNYETLIANAEKRAVRTREREIVPRPSDLYAIVASTSGKIELDYGGEESTTMVVERLLRRAMLATWDAYLGPVDRHRAIVTHFEQGWGVEVSDAMPAEEYREGIEQIPGLREAVDGLGAAESPGLMAAAVEFVLEGLHLHQKLNKDVERGRGRYHA